MKKLLVSFCLLPLLAMAQNFHFSARLGMAGYQGDLKAKTFSFSQSKFLGSIGVRYDLSEHLALRSYLTLTSLKADDKKGTASMRLRNLNFQTKIFAWEGGLHYSFLNLNEHWWTPYLFAGIGIFHFNPYTKDVSGTKTYLNPLSTEGQGFIPGVKPYKLTQFSLPLGAGVERSLNEDMRVGLELGYNKSFTDYLDDVSTVYVDQSALLAARGQKAVDLAYRGNEVATEPYPVAGDLRGSPKSKDGYFYIGLTFTFRFYFDKYKQIAGLPSSKKGKKVGCPASRVR
jgi:Outer membrane protein beta-barrel domain